MVKAYARGSEGNVIQRLQAALKITADGDFGPKTEKAVEDTQVALGLRATGRADQPLFETLGVKWPSMFERALQVTASFEGTGFGGINKRDIDNAGVTLGIVGFTTKHGEVQALLRTFLTLRPHQMNGIPSPSKEKLLVLLNSSGTNREAWDLWFYGRDGVVDKWIRDIVASWGQDEFFQRLQMQKTEESMWIPAKRHAKALGLTSEHGLALMFDIQVQNGGWRNDHQAHYNAQTHDGTEDGRIRAVVNAVASECLDKWRADVRARKEVFQTGAGRVHRRNYDLTDFAFGQI